MRRRKCDMYQDRKYVRRRALALLAFTLMVMAITTAVVLAADRLAENVCVSQLDAKAQAAIEWSKARGEYPF